MPHTQSPDVRVQSVPSCHHEMSAWQTGGVHVQSLVGERETLPEDGMWFDFHLSMGNERVAYASGSRSWSHQAWTHGIALVACGSITGTKKLDPPSPVK